MLRRLARRVSANDSGDRVLGAHLPPEIFRICFEMQAKCEIEKGGAAVYSKNAQSWHFSKKIADYASFCGFFRCVLPC
jgi:hypothetical protein